MCQKYRNEDEISEVKKNKELVYYHSTLKLGFVKLFVTFSEVLCIFPNVEVIACWLVSLRFLNLKQFLLTMHFTQHVRFINESVKNI